MSEINYFCFDIGGVANVRAPLEEVISQGKSYFGESFSAEILEAMCFPKVKDKDIWRDFQNGKTSADTYLTHALQAGSIPITSENKLFFRNLLQQWCGQPYQPMLDLVKKLNENVYPTGVLSNNNEIMYNTPGAEIKNHVLVAISSHEIGFSKPSFPAYVHLLEALGGTGLRHQVAFIDDQKENVKAASDLGMCGFNFRSKELGMDQAFAELMEYLKKNGVRV
ncbi:MAG: HAD hydrolase-like protein [Nanoarchaeota archaeon]|nr:HAD hydrolase-like protein [Nanoarchaeota archaeon]